VQVLARVKGRAVTQGTGEEGTGVSHRESSNGLWLLAKEGIRGVGKAQRLPWQQQGSATSATQGSQRSLCAGMCRNSCWVAELCRRLPQLHPGVMLQEVAS
jgi:hypothetical protein